jgi:hypothetical protein
MNRNTHQQQNTQSNMVDWDLLRQIPIQQIAKKYLSPLCKKLTLYKKLIKVIKAKRDKKLENLHKIRFEKTLTINERIKFVKDRQIIWENYSKQVNILKYKLDNMVNTMWILCN